jgi:hypothetical protein
MPARAARNPSRSRARPECRQSAAADGLRRGGAGAARLLHARASPHVRHAAVAAGSRRRRRGKGCPDTGGARWQGAALMLDVGAGSLRAEEAAPGKKLVAAVSASIYQAPVFDHGPGADASPEAPRHRHGAQAGAALNARCRDQIFGRRGNDIFDSARACTLPSLQLHFNHNPHGKTSPFSPVLSVQNQRGEQGPVFPTHECRFSPKFPLLQRVLRRSSA